MNARGDDLQRRDRAWRRKRLKMADAQITHKKTLGTVGVDEEIYVEAGFRNADEYWSDAMSEQSGFEHRLKIHFLSPTLKEVQGYEPDLEDALCFAAENGEPWIRKIDGRNFVLRPRDAAEWLMSQPTREHLVPAGLRDFLQSRSSPAAVPVKPQRRRRKRDAIKARMREWMRKEGSPAELDKLKEDSLVTMFGGRPGNSREVYGKARNEALTEVGRSRTTKSTKTT
jgi:hypothetical protein